MSFTGWFPADLEEKILISLIFINYKDSEALPSVASNVPLIFFIVTSHKYNFWL